MGTNYYLVRSEVPCPTCGHDESDEIHIGKSSAGWVFALHIYPDDGINSLEDWVFLFEAHPIRDEYGRDVSTEKMLENIRERSAAPKEKPPRSYQSWEYFHKLNHSVAGPSNLLRSEIDGRHCVGHGEGTWDCMVGEFS